MLRILLLFTLILWVGISACSSGDVRKEQAQLYLKNGTSHMSKGHYRQSLKSLLEAYRLDSEDPRILNNLGLAYYLLKNYDKALSFVGQALESRPQYSDARNNYGRILIAMGEYDQAIIHLKTVKKDLTYPTPEKALANLGLAYLNKKRFKTALKTFRMSIKTNNKYCPGHNYYGRTLLELKKYPQAINSFEKALALCRNHYDEAHYYNAIAHLRSGQREKGLARLEEVVRLYPQSDFADKALSILDATKKGSE